MPRKAVGVASSLGGGPVRTGDWPGAGEVLSSTFTLTALDHDQGTQVVY